MRRTDNLRANGGGSVLRIDLGPAAALSHPRSLWKSWLGITGLLHVLRTDVVGESFAENMALHDMASPLSGSGVEVRVGEECAAEGLQNALDPEFDAFFTRFEQPLYGYLRRMVPSDEVAMELAQEAFFRAWKRFAEVRAYDRPDAWLYRVATNLAISHLRRRKSLSFSHLFARTNEGEGADAQDETLPFADPDDLEGRVVARDAIARVLERLSERQRAALLLRTVQGFSCEEIATTLGITVTNARQTLSRARERFRMLYEAAQREG